MLMLAADVGGTNIRLQLAKRTGSKVEVIFTKQYRSMAHDSFEAVLRAFIHEFDPSVHIDSACLAVAGPVSQSRAKVTNLPWLIDAAILVEQFSIDRIQLVNDFQGVAYGIAHLHDDELVTLQAGEADNHGVVAVIGAGTGLGHAVILREDNATKVLPSEAGHMDFSPHNALEQQLLEHIRQKAGRASCESVISGPGLVTIYNFLHESGAASENGAVASIMKASDPAMAISESAMRGEPLASRALDLLLACYGAHCGNLALAWLPRGGIYLAGSIAQGNIEAISRSPFLQAFLDKAPMHDVLRTLPLHVVMCHDTGLRGALHLAGLPA
jgi:glucokinase